MAKQRRVVVTGLGAISPVGNSVEEAWSSVVSGKSGIGPITAFDTSKYEVRIAGEVRNFDITQYVSAKEARRMDRFIQFAVAAAGQAIKHAQYVVTPENAEVSGVLASSGIGGIITISESLHQLDEKGPNRVQPFTIPMLLMDLAAGQISIQYGFKGTNFCPASACSSSAHAIGEGYEIIKRGDADAILAAGGEATVMPLGIAAFNVMHALSQRNDEPTRASRPFDGARSGFVLAEGGAALLLEDRDTAIARGATILGEVVGYGSTADANHVTAPVESGEGATRAMKMALRKAGLKPQDIGYLNAHGTSTILNEKCETRAIKGAFGDYAYQLPISSTKSMTGHMLGAAGAIEAVFCLKAMETGCLPPTINQEVPDPECDLDYIPNHARPARVNYCMSNSMGFGGHNVALILASPEIARADD